MQTLSRKSIAWLGLLAVVLYSIWIGGPYLRSIVVRNAAVSTWIHVATSPIEGQVVDAPLRPGDRVAANGTFLTVANPRVDPSALSHARADLESARARVASLDGLVGSLQILESSRRHISDEYTSVFKSNLDGRIVGLTAYLAASRARLELDRAEAGRLAQLRGRGVESQSAADAAAAKVATAEVDIADKQASLNRSLINRRAADAGLFYLDDGSDGSAARRDLEEATIALERARADLASARRDVEARQRVVDEATQAIDQRRTAAVSAMAGGLVLNVSVAPGATVQVGTPIGAWIDCRVMLVDVPVSDVALSLLQPGMPANVVLEGERRSRVGSVLLVRGAAATLGASDLAAVAKGRTPGVAQVVVRLEPTPADIAACPIGRAAFVYFPGVDVWTILRARLRF